MIDTLPLVIACNLAYILFIFISSYDALPLCNLFSAAHMICVFLFHAATLCLKLISQFGYFSPCGSHSLTMSI